MHHKRYISFQAASSMVKEPPSGQNNGNCPIMPRFTMQHVPSTPKPNMPRKIKPIISAGAGACVFGSVIRVFFFSDSQSPELILAILATHYYWLLSNKLKIKICSVGTLQQIKIDNFAQWHDSDSIACLTCYHKKIETVDRMVSQAQDISASLDY